MYQQISTPQEIDRFFYPLNYDSVSIRVSPAPPTSSHRSRRLLTGAEDLFDIDYLHEFHLCLLRESFGLDRRRGNRKMCPVTVKRMNIVK